MRKHPLLFRTLDMCITGVVKVKQQGPRGEEWVGGGNRETYKKCLDEQEANHFLNLCGWPQAFRPEREEEKRKIATIISPLRHSRIRSGGDTTNTCLSHTPLSSKLSFLFFLRPSIMFWSFPSFSLFRLFGVAMIKVLKLALFSFLLSLCCWSTGFLSRASIFYGGDRGREGSSLRSCPSHAATAGKDLGTRR